MTTIAVILILFSFNSNQAYHENRGSISLINPDTIIYKGGKPIIKILGENINQDTLTLGKEYLIEIIIPDVPSKNQSIAVTKGNIKPTENPGTYLYKPFEEGQAIISIGFYYRNKKIREYIEERYLIIKK